MNILVIGGTGVVGKAAVKAIEVDAKGKPNNLILASRKTNPRIDATNEASVRSFFENLREETVFDAVICAFGEVETSSWKDFNVSALNESLDSKLLSQMLILKYGEHKVRDGGSFTLTTGITSDEFVVNGMNKTIVNRAIEGFVETVALELTRGIRVNAVSPGLLEESAPQAQHLFPGLKPVSGRRVGLEYQKSVFGIQTGKIFRAYE